MFDITTYTIIFMVITASVIHGLIGFGFALIMVPVFSLLFPKLTSGVPIIVILGLVIDLIILFDSRQHIEVKKISHIIFFGILGLPIGTFILIISNENILRLFVGAILLVFSLLLFKGYNFKTKHEKVSLSFSGFISGILNSSLSLGRLPIALIMSNNGWKKDSYRANATLYFTILDIATILIFISKGLIKTEMFSFVLYLIPVLITGLFVGMLLSKKISENFFKKVVLIVIITFGSFMTLISLKNMFESG